MDNNKFTVIIDEKKYDAYILSNFSLMDNYYCAYAVDIGNENRDVFCDRVVNNNLEKIENEKELKMVMVVVNSIINILKVKGVNTNE